MKAYFYSRNTVVLIILVGLTLTSWYFGLEPATAGSGVQWSGIAMLILAFIKVRLVIQNFMEVRDAPLPLKLSCDAWVIGALVAVCCTYAGVFS